MTLDNYISLISAVSAFGGLLLVAWQIRGSIKQAELDSVVKIYDINRKLLTLGCSHPQLFAVMEDKDVDPATERRVLQLWLNQFSLIHTYLEHSVIQGELKDSLIRDLSDFLALQNMRRHWHRFGRFYPASFQKLVNSIMRKDEPPPKTTTHPSSGI